MRQLCKMCLFCMIVVYIGNNFFMMRDLDIYNKKRNFEITKEPKGKTKNSNGKKNKIFCVQYHLARAKHYDFRLEYKGVLISFAVPKGPSYNVADKRLAIKVEDHPIDYADFEGVIPKGQYGGGSVMLWDYGHWQETEDFGKGLKKGILKFELFGERLKGGWSLIKLKNSKDGDNWLLVKEKDKFAKKTSGIKNFNTSIKTGRTSQQIFENDNLVDKRNPFDKVSVQLAILEKQVPTGKNWIYEIKYDGYRILAFIENDSVKLITRNGKDMSQKFQEVVLSLKKLAKGRAMVLDGEMIVVDKNGKSDFNYLQNYVKNPDNYDLVYMIFDILALDGQDLRDIKLIERKDILKKLIKSKWSNLMLCQYVCGMGKECFEIAKNLGLEGIIAKDKNSVYSGERRDWIKIKCRKLQEFVVGGYTRTSKKTDGISAILLGVYKDNKFVYCGKAGTGIDKSASTQLLNLFSKPQKNSPFANKCKNLGDAKVFWVKPQIVVNIEYAEITADNLLRQSSFKGIRIDKEATDVCLEEKNNLVDVKISNPDKVIFDDDNIKKIDVINYYNAVGERMLKYAKNRLLTVVRCHNGIQDCFYKKHPTKKYDGVGILNIENSNDEKDEYFYLEDSRGLISQTQLGTLEYHLWGSSIDDIDKPNMMVFDFDPDENMELEQLRKGVKDLKKILDTFGLKSFLKTSGGKGYHIVVPFASTSDWDTFSAFAQKVANLLANKYPNLYTCNMRKSARKNKIFIDYLRNSKGATSVAPYSLRARSGATVSMPIYWSELDKIAPNQIDMWQAMERIKKTDPWKDFFDVKQKLK